jgi:hypothetical protein
VFLLGEVMDNAVIIRGERQFAVSLPFDFRRFAVILPFYGVFRKKIHFMADISGW